MILLIDNYDSFVYNLYQYLRELGAEVQVARNDKVTLADIEEVAPEAIVVSPGPGYPKDAGVSCEAIRRFGPRIPVLGVCLGSQCIGAAFGATVDRAGEVMHGKSSWIHHDGRGVLRGLPNPLEAIRYHSLAVMREGLPDGLGVSAWTDRGIIMGLRHRRHPIEGVQFHPESIMTREGKALLGNFLDGVRRYVG